MLFITLMSPKGKRADTIKYLKKLKPPEEIKIAKIRIILDAD